MSTQRVVTDCRPFRPHRGRGGVSGAAHAPHGEFAISVGERARIGASDVPITPRRRCARRSPSWSSTSNADPENWKLAYPNFPPGPMTPWVELARDHDDGVAVATLVEAAARKCQIVNVG